MLDYFIFGSTSRISPEAPVPIVKFNNELISLGGSGNVIMNLLNLNIDIIPVSIIGNDETGKNILNEFKKYKLSTKYIFKSKDINSTKKMRIITDKQHVVRVDWDSSKIPKTITKKIVISVNELLDNVDALIVSDYGKGLCTDSIVTESIKTCISNNVPIFIDPKGVKWHKYSSATYITPNVNETKDIVNMDLNNDNDFERAGRILLDEYNFGNCLITRGSYGMSLINNDQIIHTNTEAKEVFDVSGAGDTVISCLAAAIVSGASIESAIEFANKAAGIVVAHVGTKPVTKKELLKV